MSRALCLLLMLLVFVTPAAAQTVPAPNPFGLGWGAGFGFSANTRGASIVGEGDAFIDDGGIVRVTHPQNVKPRVLLETHYTFRMMRWPIAIGPTMFIQPGDTLFNAAGGGLIIELGDGPTAMNLIVGVLLDFDVSRLHRDYIDGFVAPTRELIFVQREELQFLIGFAVGRPF